MRIVEILLIYWIFAWVVWFFYYHSVIDQDYVTCKSKNRDLCMFEAERNNLLIKEGQYSGIKSTLIVLEIGLKAELIHCCQNIGICYEDNENFSIYDILLILMEWNKEKIKIVNQLLNSKSYLNLTQVLMNKEKQNCNELMMILNKLRLIRKPLNIPFAFPTVGGI
jgi:hypothetical protein